MPSWCHNFGVKFSKYCKSCTISSSKLAGLLAESDRSVLDRRLVHCSRSRPVSETDIKVTQVLYSKIIKFNLLLSIIHDTSRTTTYTVIHFNILILTD